MKREQAEKIAMRKNLDAPSFVSYLPERIEGNDWGVTRYDKGTRMITER